MFDSGIAPARGIWWKPAHRTEKVWIAVAFVWCLILFAMMPLWHLKGGQNTTGIRHRVEPADFEARTNQFIADYRVGEEAGLPVVEPPPGADVYLLGKMWQWTPVLRLREGVRYRIHLSSLDVNHGFNLYPFNINFQVVPGYDYALDVTPTEAGDFRIVCNEFCGVGHHVMVGRIEVLPAEGAGDEGGAVAKGVGAGADAAVAAAGGDR